MFPSLMRVVFALVVAITFGIPAVDAQEKRGAKRPNILFCFADDWGRYASAYSSGKDDRTPNSVVKTPNFDRIAKDGVLFNNAFVCAPSCTPCRSALLSGQYFYRTGRGAILQGARWDAGIPSYPLLLQKAGYHIGHTYKVWSPGTPANAPYGARETAYNSAGRRFNRFSQFVSPKSKTKNAKQQLYEEVAGNFEAFLKKREAGQPFCYWFGPTNVHRKWIAGSGKKLWGINPDTLKGKLPPFLPDVPVVRQDFADYLGEVQAFDAGVGVLLKKLEAMGELENTVIVISGDHGAPGFPRGKCNLYDFGVHVALAVRVGQAFQPDPKGGRLSKAQGTPGQAGKPDVRGGRVVDDFVNLMDLAPTFLEIGGVKPPQVMTGRSLVPVLKSQKNGQVDNSRDYVVVGRERHVAAVRTGNLPYPQRAIRTKDFLYIRNFKPDRWPMGDDRNITKTIAPSKDRLTNNTFVTFGDMDASPTKAWLVLNRNKPGAKKYYDWAFAKRPEEELYDLRKDPHQIQNVAQDPEYAKKRAELYARLMEVLKSTGDPRVTGDGSTFDKPPYTDAFKRKRRKSSKSRE